VTVVRRAPPGLRFTERMAGAFSPGVEEGYEHGYRLGLEEGSLLEFVATIEYEDVRDVVARASTPARITGTVLAPALSARRLTIADGTFVLLQEDPDHVETSKMRYAMELLDERGRRFTLEGFKLIQDRAGFDVWSDTTTLYVTVRDDAGDALGVGVMRLGVLDFLRQLTTMTILRVPGLGRRLLYQARFGATFLGSLFRIYGGPLEEPWRFPRPPEVPTIDPPILRPPNGGNGPVPTGEVRWLDGTGAWNEGREIGPDAWLRLTRYEGGEKGPLVLASGFGMSAFSFATDAVQTNLVEHVVRRGYDVWLFDYRDGIDLPSAPQPSTIDDIALRDWPTAVAEVLRVTGKDSVQALGHCVGSVSLLMAMLAGTEPMDRVRTAVCAQFMLFIETSWFNRLKARLHVGQLLESLGLRLVRPNVAGRWPDVVMDLALRALPMPRGERCGIALCRWVNAIYGCTHAHDPLNQGVHQRLPALFGVANLEALQQLALMVQHGKVVDHEGRDVYLPNHLRLVDTRILFLQGERNYIFLPEGSRRTLRFLRKRNGPDRYRREILRGYAHLDAMIGRDADRDVFPKISAFLDQHQTVPA
jgi:cholesterol oxidase